MPMSDLVWMPGNHHFLVVEQTPAGMVVRSRHRRIKAARRAGRSLIRRFPDLTLALVRLFANYGGKYRAGDVVRPSDISWGRVSDKACSMCTHPYSNPIESLDHSCPILYGHPKCHTAQAARFRPPDEPHGFDRPGFYRVAVYYDDSGGYRRVGGYWEGVADSRDDACLKAMAACKHDKATSWEAEILEVGH
jgi:hypothetical protein